MSVTTEYVYGSYYESTLPYLDDYGISDTKYGVVVDPYSPTFAFLLLEDGYKLLQEDSSEILL